MRFHRMLTVILVAILLAAAPATRAAGEPLRVILSDLQGYRPSLEVERGDWIFFDLEPVTLRPFYRGPIRIDNFTVMGDFEEIEWQTAPGAPVHTFPRAARRVVDDEAFSVFHLSFPATELRRLDPLPIRFDQNHGSAAWPFRIRSAGIPNTEVVRINDRVQYSSHVVNIVAPDVVNDGTLPRGDRIFNVLDLLETFYTHFTDSYEEVSFVPTRSHRRPTGFAYRIAGGVPQRLVGGNVHVRGDMIWNVHTLHETGHQWGFRFDLFAVAGVEPQVSTQCIDGGHTPLIADLPSFLTDSCRLNKTRHGPLCIQRDEKGWVLGHCELPLSYHPLQLYAMGLLAKDEVPPLYLRLRQDPIRPIEPGTRVEGPFVKLTIDDVVAHYGERQGSPMPAIWRRALVVISPERLLSPGQLAWFNFFAKRTSDPNVTGIEGLDRSPSMEFATRGMVDLRTDIRPIEEPKVIGRFPVAYPKVGPRDIAGLVLDEDLTTRYKVRRFYVVSGKVPGRGNHQTVRIEVASKVFLGKIGADRRFSVRFRLDPKDRGPRWMTFGLGESGPVLGRIAPVYVE